MPESSSSVELVSLQITHLQQYDHDGGTVSSGSATYTLNTILRNPNMKTTLAHSNVHERNNIITSVPVKYELCRSLQ